MNSLLLQELKASLEERLKIIADHELRLHHPALQLEKLKEASEKIEKCEALLISAKIDPKLKHYLEQRSYQKALERLEQL